MKDLIVIIGTVVLGCIIFSMILGDNDSLRERSEEAVAEAIEIYNER